MQLSSPRERGSGTRVNERERTSCAASPGISEQLRMNGAFVITAGREAALTYTVKGAYARGLTALAPRRAADGMFPALSNQLEASPIPTSLTMSMSLHHERDNIYQTRYARPAAEARSGAMPADPRSRRCGVSGPVRLLFVLDGFEGWDPNDGLAGSWRST